MLMAALALPLAVSASAAIPTDPLSFDVQCLLATGYLAQNAPEEHRRTALAASTYYLGRLDGRGPSLDLEARFVAEAAAMRGQDVRELVRACGALMVERGAAVRAMSQRIRAREQAAPAR